MKNMIASPNIEISNGNFLYSFDFFKDFVKYLTTFDAPIPEAIQTAGAMTNKSLIITP